MELFGLTVQLMLAIHMLTILLLACLFFFETCLSFALSRLKYTSFTSQTRHTYASVSAVIFPKFARFTLQMCRKHVLLTPQTRPYNAAKCPQIARFLPALLPQFARFLPQRCSFYAVKMPESRPFRAANVP